MQNKEDVLAWLQEHLKGEIETFGDGGPGFEFKRSVPWVTCANGGRVSVQASAHTYCRPRNNEGPYTHVELGFPTGLEGKQLIIEYAEDPENWEETVYGYVPIEKVAVLILMNGGVK